MATDRDFKRALDVLEVVADDENPCRHDHHGQCQTHGPGGEIDERCWNLVALDLLDEYRPGWSE